MAFRMEASGVPVGSYRAKFTEWPESVHEQYGDRICWTFEIVAGEQRGNKTTRYTGARLRPRTEMAKILSGIARRKIEVGDEANPDDFIGKEYMVIVEETDSGATRVSAVLPVDE